MRVVRNEIVSSGIEVGKITTASSGDRYLLANLACMLEYGGLATSLSRFNRTKKTRRATAYDYHIRLLHAQSVSLLIMTKEKAAKLRSLLFTFWLLSTLWFSNRVWFRGVVKLSCLNDEFLIVSDAVAVDIDTDLNFVLLAVAHVARIESQAVLAAQQRID
jgi:hypothetical protein